MTENNLLTYFPEDLSVSLANSYFATGMRWAEILKYLILLRTCDDYKKKLIANPVIYDLGCGSADSYIFLNANLKFDFKYIGVDLRNDLHKNCLGKNFDFYQEDIYDFVQQNASMLHNSIVLLFDIIEHLPLAHRFTLLDNILKVYPNFVLLTTPNFGVKSKLVWPEYHLFEFSYADLVMATQKYRVNYDISIFGLYFEKDIYDKLIQSKSFSDNEILLTTLFPDYFYRALLALRYPESASQLLLKFIHHTL